MQDEWRARLAESGFVDEEDERGNLKQYDRRTNAFENRDAVFEFYRRLDHFLASGESIPELHRQVLELYTQGIQQCEIRKRVGRSRTTIDSIIRAYRELIIQRHLVG